jgi:formate dehydrogenase major subunit
VSQHVHGTDNARCLIALALSTGQIGRPGTGLHPLRGQNNVQGASDVGLIPMVYPDYQSVTNSKVQAQFEELWGTELSPKTGLTATEIMDAADAGQIRGMYLMGENPAMSDPDANHVRHALAKLDWFVVQEIFLTETAYFADVILPATAWPEKDGTVTNTDRMVQLGRKAIEPPGEARPDLWIIQQIAQRLGLDWNYAGPRDVFNEMRRAMPSIAGITWERLQAENTVTYPCEKEGDPGEPVVFIDSFPTGDGRGRIVPADILPPDERPDGEYPFVLITGRQLEHWHTGAMTRRASALDAIEPVAVASMHPLDLAELGVEPGGVITVTSRRGTITIYARSDDGTPRGAVFIPFCFYEAAVNLVTNSAIDPEAKIPEAKYCAVRVAPGGELQPISSYGGGQILAKVAAPTA